MQIGKMYCVKQLCWLLFPTKELAGGPLGAMAYQDAKRLSERYNCNFTAFVEPNTCFVLLEKDEAYFKVLDSNGNIGWIVCWDVSNYFEIVNDANR